MTDQGPQATFIRNVAGGFVAAAIVVAALISCGTAGQARVALATRNPGSGNRPVAVGSGNSPVTVADGYIADGEWLSPFDIGHPAIANLDQSLLEAVQRASSDAAREGVNLSVSSGWRSARYQQALLDDAILFYGSEAEARKWVNTPEKSTHVAGTAVDLGPTGAARWLSRHGADYGLCQIYANEAWHYERAIEPGGICPPLISDASVG
jgi:D-alanyl-D-alanine carboxypeptidase